MIPWILHTYKELVYYQNISFFFSTHINIQLTKSYSIPHISPFPTTLQSSLPDTSIEGSVREKSTLQARFSCSSYSITLWKEKSSVKEHFYDYMIRRMIRLWKYICVCRSTCESICYPAIKREKEMVLLPDDCLHPKQSLSPHNHY